jgi:hypothetical protein
MAQILYRKLGPNNDPYFGQGQANFISDAEAVAQAIRTRLLLLQGEWWEDINQGTPLFQSILGQPSATPETTALILTQRIAGAPYVTGVTNVSSTENAQRQAQFSAQANTVFGPVTVTNS